MIKYQSHNPNKKSSDDNELPSVKLFKRMTQFKKENNDLKIENMRLREKCDDIYYLN